MALQEVTIYTDGSSRGNPGPGGYGTVLLFGKHRKELSAGFRKTTNNRMEILAAIAGLEALTQACAVTVHSDSQYLVKAMNENWVGMWKAQRWIKRDRMPVKNIDLWKRLETAIGEHAVTWKWVRGHDGNEENERCDALATEAAAGDPTTPDSGFEDQEAEPTQGDLL